MANDVVLWKPEQIWAYPDSTVIEIVAQVQGLTGTLAVVKGAFTVNGVEPHVLNEPLDPNVNHTSHSYWQGSGYTLGGPGADTNYQVVAPQRIALTGTPARPYTLWATVYAQQVHWGTNTARFIAHLKINFPASMDHISGVVPLTQIGTAQAAMQPFSAAVTTWVDTKRIITTVYKATLAVADLQYFDLVAKVVGAATSKALGRTHVRVSYEPDPPPTLPDYGAPFDGASEVDDLFTLLDERPTGRGFRGLRTTRKLYAKVRSEDSEDPNNIHEAEVELTIIPTVTVTGLNVLVRNQQSVMRLEELPVVDGAYEIMVGDLETIGVMLQPTGTLGEQAILRGRYATYDADPPTLQPIQDVVTYNTDAAAAPFDVDDSASLGVFGIDRKADLLAPMMGIAFRRDYPTGLVQFIVDATSTDSLANTIQRSFKLRSVTPQTLTEIKFSYVNSRNPNDICLIRNNVSDGGDVNGVITGAGTFDDPYIIPVDMPEQFQAFAMAQQLFATSQAWVQTGYAFGTNPVDIIYPATPAAWKRAFDRSQRVGVVPHPVAPGTATLRPPTMAELMEASFGTPVGDPGTEVGYTGKIKLYARGQSLANELNVVEKTIVIRLADPTVLAP